MNNAAMTLFQMRFINKAFWRNPASAFFTFAFPLMFLVIFTALLGGGEVQLGGRVIHQSAYYVAAMAAFAVITACYNNISIGLAFQRDAGVLKRTRGTPLPSAVFFGAKVMHALLVALLLVAITVTFGKVLYSAEIPTGASLFQFLVILVVGAASFCALGFAITTVIPNADAAARSSTQRSFRCCSCQASSSRSETTRQLGSPGLRGSSQSNTSPTAYRLVSWGPRSAGATSLSWVCGALAPCWSHCGSSAGNRAGEGDKDHYFSILPRSGARVRKRAGLVPYADP